MNNCSFIGNLVKEPQIAKNRNDEDFSIIVLAVKREDNTNIKDFIRCYIHKETARYIYSNAHIGDMLSIEGELNYYTTTINGTPVDRSFINCRYCQLLKRKYRPNDDEQRINNIRHEIEYPEITEFNFEVKEPGRDK